VLGLPSSPPVIYVISIVSIKTLSNALTWAGEHGLVLDCLPSTYEGLDSILSTTKKKKKPKQTKQKKTYLI
jgi:cbb3-type cytochrome oxidase subunit 1